MNTEPLVDKLANDLLKVANTGCIKVHVCYFEQEIAARVSNHTLKPHPVLAIYYSDDIQTGLTAKQWRTLGAEIGTFLKEKRLCLPSTKTSTKPKPNSSKT